MRAFLEDVWMSAGKAATRSKARSESMMGPWAPLKVELVHPPGQSSFMSLIGDVDQYDAMRRRGETFCEVELVKPNVLGDGTAPMRVKNEIAVSLIDGEDASLCEELYQLMESIKEKGIVTPILVKRACSRYELVDGQRRLTAARILGMRSVPCVISDREDVVKMRRYDIPNATATHWMKTAQDLSTCPILPDDVPMSDDDLTDAIVQAEAKAKRRCVVSGLSEAQWPARVEKGYERLVEEAKRRDRALKCRFCVDGVTTQGEEISRCVMCSLGTFAVVPKPKQDWTALYIAASMLATYAIGIATAWLALR